MSEALSSERNNNMFVPLALGLLSIVIWFVFQSSQLIRERGNLKQTYASQEIPLQTAQKMRTQMDVIASGTAKLAAQDNANAKSFLQALAARGITIDPNAKTPAPPQ